MGKGARHVTREEQMIRRFRLLCQQNDQIVGVLMFGSHASGEADAYSDIEFAVFLRPDAIPEFEQKAFLETLSPVAAYFPDDFGHHTALFENGVRGEFHFKSASEIPVIATWREYAWFQSLDTAVLLDRTGEVARYARDLVGAPVVRQGEALVERLALNLINLSLFGSNLLGRGEYARAWALLGKVHEYLLKLVRIQEGSTSHWPTPSRALEQDLSSLAYERYTTCTASAQPGPLTAAYRNTWTWSRELMQALTAPMNIHLPTVVMAHVDRLLDEAELKA